MTLRPRTTAQTVIIINCCICPISTTYLQRVVDPGVTGDPVQTPPAPRYGPRSVPRLVMKVSSRVFRTWSQQTYYQTTGAPGAPGAPAVTPVVGLTPGLVTVSEETVPLGHQDVLERIQRPNPALKLTKVVFARNFRS